MRAEEDSRYNTITGLPRIVAETTADAAKVVAAARQMPKIFTGLGADVYLDLTPPFVVGTHVSENAITVWQEAAGSDPSAVESLASLGLLGQAGVQADVPQLGIRRM